MLRAHWLNPDLLAADQFAECFAERGVQMMKLIGQAMGKQLSDGRSVFWSALESAGFVEEYDDPDDEHDEVGLLVHEDDDAAIAAD